MNLFKINPMRNIGGRLLALALFGWPPILLEIFINLFQVIGLFIVRAIEVEPMGFAIGFIIIFGLAREGRK
jgi:hypothetical protein